MTAEHPTYANIVRAVKAALGRHLEIRPGEFERVAKLSAFLFFLLAANSVIKVVRDSLFLSRFPITQLPYVYLLAALIAAGFILLYSRYAAELAFSRLVLASLVLTICSVVLFWLLVRFAARPWVFYAYYLWSAVVGLILVAQFWTFANELFNPRDGKRLFGLITAGGTLGGVLAGIASNVAVNLVGTNQLLWLAAGFLAGAYGTAHLILRKQALRPIGSAKGNGADATHDLGGIASTIIRSPYLQVIGAVIFISVIVSTLIDYQFKAMAKDTYPSADALAGFFATYYAWLSVITLLAQLCLTGKALIHFGLIPSLLILPAALLGGSFAAIVWPSVAAVTANRMAEASLRTSVNQSGLQILYLPVPDAIKKKVKVFMDVTVERFGDAVAALIILAISLALDWSPIGLLSYICTGLIVIWMILVLQAQKGYVQTLRHSLADRAVSLEAAPIDFSDRATVDAVLRTLDEKDESSVLFALSLAEKMGPSFVLARLPAGVLRHSSAEVRRYALRLFAASLESNTLAIVFELLAAEDSQLRSEAINTIAIVLKEAAVPVIRPFLGHADIRTRSAAIRLLLQSGDEQARGEALAAFRILVKDRSPAGEALRIEACRLMGEIEIAEFTDELIRLIRHDPSVAVAREAMMAAARRKNSAVIRDILARLGCDAIGTGARDALIEYGDVAVKELRAALYDSGIARDIRLQVPKTLSQINSQLALNALQGGLLEEDRVIRFQVIRAIEEMARRFPHLRTDREIIESAIMSDALVYFRRLVIFSALFTESEQSAVMEPSLLYHALSDSMRRVKERIMLLLPLIYPRQEIRPLRAGLIGVDPVARAHAIELLDNLLTGNLKRYVFPLFSDRPRDERLSAALDHLALRSMSLDAAIRALLDQDDRWLKAAAIWEIGQRGLSHFREDILRYAACDDALLRETARHVIERESRT